ncbi:alpha-ribazole phosphatase [Arenicella xantha]|uniref:Alpha-ribazole phosphatase n=1 Tax=Arenicella xantha TaxID=644221 RepID=A0A395JFZ9_9GAMM|nr:alpha-ribazole phosphatase [Arenicella xantha]RBP48598.1 alpha-ribazole phosphatase [Arenicella xantha]
MKIHLIRHTQVAVEPGICYGDSDVELATTFEQDANAVLAKLRSDYDAVYSSPLQRCVRLAKHINGDEYFYDSRLKEYNFGDWELHAWNDLPRSKTQSWMDNYVEQSAPGGESMLQMHQRVIEFWSELLANRHKHVAVVAHAGILRLIHAHIFEAPLTQLFRLQLDYGTVIEVCYIRDSNYQTLRVI